MKNLKCFFLNVYSLDRGFVFQDATKGKPDVPSPAPNAPKNAPNPALDAKDQEVEARKEAAKTADKNRIKIPEWAKDEPKQVAAKPKASDDNEMITGEKLINALLPLARKREAMEAEARKLQGAKKESAQVAAKLDDDLMDPWANQKGKKELDKQALLQMDNASKREKFLQKQGDNMWLVDFKGKGSVAEKTLGLKHLFNKTTPFLQVKNAQGAWDYDAQYINGNFINIQTGKPAKIYHGYGVYEPKGNDLVELQKLADKYKSDREKAVRVALNKQVENFINKTYPVTTLIPEQIALISSTLVNVLLQVKKDFNFKKDKDLATKVAEKFFKDPKQAEDALAKWAKENLNKKGPTAVATVTPLDTAHQSRQKDFAQFLAQSNSPEGKLITMKKAITDFLKISNMKFEDKTQEKLFVKALILARNIDLRNPQDKEAVINSYKAYAERRQSFTEDLMVALVKKNMPKKNDDKNPNSPEGKLIAMKKAITDFLKISNMKFEDKTQEKLFVKALILARNIDLRNPQDKEAVINSYKAYAERRQSFTEDLMVALVKKNMPKKNDDKNPTMLASI